MNMKKENQGFFIEYSVGMFHAAVLVAMSLVAAAAVVRLAAH